MPDIPEFVKCGKEDQELKVILGYLVSLRPAWAMGELVYEQMHTGLHIRVLALAPGVRTTAATRVSLKPPPQHMQVETPSVRGLLPIPAVRMLRLTAVEAALTRNGHVTLLLKNQKEQTTIQANSAQAFQPLVITR